MRFDKKAALNADRGGMITKSGYYKGEIVSAKCGRSKNNAKYIEFEFKSDFGEIAKYLTIYTNDRNGDYIFGYDKICALMGILAIDELKFEPDTLECNILKGNKIGLSLQKEEYENNKNELKFKMIILHFHRYSDDKTYSEIENNTKAVVYKREIKDKLLSSTVKSYNEPEIDINDDSLPF